MIVFVTAGIIPIIGMVALTLDFGMYYEVRRQLQNAADAAAHAGAQELPDLVAAGTKAQEYFDLNRPTVGTSTIAIEYPSDTRLRIVAEAEVPTIFARVFGLDFLDVAVAAAVAIDEVQVDVVVVIDRSGSMCQDSHWLMLTCPDPPSSPNYWAPFNDVQNAALAFPQYVMTHPLDRLALVTYSYDGSLDVGLTEGYPTAFPLIQTAVNALAPAGYTNIGHGIAVAHQALGPDPDRTQVIVLLTDGIPNRYPDGSGGWSTCSPSTGCSASFDYGFDEADAAAANGINIYTIGLGDSVDDDYLEEIASIGGGQYIFSPSGAELEAAFAQIARWVKLSFVE